MSRHYRPASLRYLKARLWNLARPSFWGTAIFLAVVGMGLYEYWTNPDFWNKWQQKSANSSQLAEFSISDADKPVLADIDNLPVLLNDRAKANFSSTAPITIPKTQKADNKTLLDDLTNTLSKNLQNKAKSESSIVETNPISNLQIENPFLTQAENLLKGNNSQTENYFLGINSFPGNYLNPQVTTTPLLGVGLHTKTSTNPNIPITSPLQAAINNSIQQSLTNPLAKKSGNNFSLNNSLNQPGVNNTGLQSPGINNLSGVTSVTNYTQSTQSKQQPNTSNFNPGYIQPGLTNRQLNQRINILPNNQEFNTGYSQPKPMINLNPTQQSSTGYIQSGLKQQQQIPTQPLPQVTSPSTSYSRPATNQGIPQPNNYDNTVWEQLIPRSQYNQIQSQSSSNN